MSAWQQAKDEAERQQISRDILSMMSSVFSEGGVRSSSSGGQVKDAGWWLLVCTAHSVFRFVGRNEVEIKCWIKLTESVSQVRDPGPCSAELQVVRRTQ